jgi:hypothetical protein
MLPELAVLSFLIASQAPSAVLDPSRGVVLSEAAGKPLHRERLCNRPMPWPIEATWVPDESTIKRLEAALGAALQAALDQAPAGRYPKPVAPEFYRQYLGLVVGGKRIVYVNGLRDQLVASGRPAEWRTTVWNGCDGGLAAFGAEYDLESGHIRNVIFNGGGRGRDGTG